MVNFKVGDKVVKYQEYSPEDYCHYGGYAYEVPIGTKGIVDDVDGTKIKVEFENGVNWNVDVSEISLDVEIKEIETDNFKAIIDEETITIIDNDGDCIEIPKNKVKELIKILKK